MVQPGWGSALRQVFPALQVLEQQGLELVHAFHFLGR